MTEQYRTDVQNVEEQLGITFDEADPVLLDKLNNQLEQVSNELGVSFHKSQIPTRGFISKSLSKEQEQGVNHFFEEEYASAAVQLQDRLTKIPVTEGGERMVYIPTLFRENNILLSLSTLPFHGACGDWGGKERVFWAREQVADRILKSGKALDTVDIVLHIEDAFRPVGVQEGLFLRRAKMILKEHPEWIEDWEKVWAEARSKTAITPLMAGHKSGAALDITLRRKSDGSTLSMGNKYPEGGAKVALRYPYVTQKEWSSRQLFTQTMEMAGLRIYPYETWHASYGDLSAGIAAFSDSDLTPNYEAIYGPLEGFDGLTGEVYPYPAEKYNQPFFTQSQLLKMIRSDV